MRIKLSEKYKNERQQICEQIIDIINLDETGSFLLSEIDENIDKQNKIIDLHP